MTGMAKLKANSDRPRVAASSNARSLAASQPTRTMPKIGAMISTMTDIGIGCPLREGWRSGMLGRKFLRGKI